MTRLLKSFFIFVTIMIASVAFSITANAAEFCIDNDSKYTVSEGSVYWESSNQWGSGRHGTVCDGNRYTDIVNGKCDIWIDGFSVIDKNGDIIESFFDNKVQKLTLPTVSSEQELMVHVWGKNYRLGWIKYSEVMNSNNEISEYIVSEITEEQEKEWFENSDQKSLEQTVDTLKSKIDEDSEIPRESYILADFSGSMVDFQVDVLQKLKDTDGKKFVFAEYVEEFFLEKDIRKYNIGGATDIANALNKVNFENDSHIYILSDLIDNCGTEIKLNKEFVGEITIVYYPSSDYLALYFMDQIRDAYPNAMITGF